MKQKIVLSAGGFLIFLGFLALPVPSQALDGAGLPGQISFWTASSTLAGDSDFWWDSVRRKLQIGPGGTVNGARLVINGNDSLKMGLYINNTDYGAIAFGLLNGLQGQGTGPASTGVYGAGEYIGVSGTSKMDNGYAALSGQQLNPNGFGLHVIGNKNYFNGSLGLGTESPTAKLEILSSGSGNYFTVGDGSSRNSFSIAPGEFRETLAPASGLARVFGKSNSDGSNYTELMRLTSSGNLGLGNNFPTSKLTVNGAVEIGSASRRTGVTLYDEITGSPYCLKIANAVTKVLAGKCL